MGLFDINMPLLYGEGEKAFIRLQEEIIKSRHDLTILCWVDPDGLPSAYGALTTSPKRFSMAHATPTAQPSLRPRSTISLDSEYAAKEFTATNRGIRLSELYLVLQPLSSGEIQSVANILICCRSWSGIYLGICVTHRGHGIYSRHRTSELFQLDNQGVDIWSSRGPIYILTNHLLHPPHSLFSRESCAILRLRISSQKFLENVEPPQFWIWEWFSFVVPKNLTPILAFIIYLEIPMEDGSAQTHPLMLIREFHHFHAGRNTGPYFRNIFLVDRSSVRPSISRNFLLAFRTVSPRSRIHFVRNFLEDNRLQPSRELILRNPKPYTVARPNVRRAWLEERMEEGLVGSELEVSVKTNF